MGTSVGYSSHLPVLMKVMNMTYGPVLELGTGMYSTPYLHWACYPTRRRLLSIDSQSKYLDLMERFRCDWHSLQLVNNWDDANIAGHWDVVLVDHEPCGRRIQEIKRLANSALYIVVHDSELRRDKDYHYKEIYPLFEYKWDFKDVYPHTCILSNYMVLKDFRL
jgi:hypothetical protein